MSFATYNTGNTGSYRFYLTIGSSVTEVFPLNFRESLLIDEQEKGEIFYRRKYSGSLTFVNGNGDDDFDLLHAVETVVPCTEILFLIEREEAYYWDGYFSTTDGIFDLDKCTFEVTPLPKDDYAAIYDLADIQYNVLSMTDPATSIQYPPVTTTAYILGLVDPAIVYTRNRWLANVIEFLCDVVAPGATYSSDFFTAADNPATLNSNKLLYLTIAQKSDIKRPLSTDPATTAMLSFNELMEILWVMFQVKWEYDSVAGNFKIEHISDWPPSAGLNLVNQEIARNNKYSYIKEKMPKYEKFTFMEADNINFVGVPIWYDSPCVNPDPDSNVLEKRVNITTDLEYIIENVAGGNGEAISDDGFVILCNYVDGGDYFVDIGLGSLNGDIRLNMYLSWANLLNYYYRHNRVLISGYLNNNIINFWSAQKTKQQECFAIVCPDDDYDPVDYITTELGETWFLGEKAKVKQSSLNPSGEMKFTLLYGPADNENTGVVIGKGILVVQTDKDTFKATLTEPADGDLDLIIREEIYTDGCAWDCLGGDETWTILTGEKESTYTYTHACRLSVKPVGYFNSIGINSAGAPGWSVNYEPMPIYDADENCGI